MPSGGDTSSGVRESSSLVSDCSVTSSKTNNTQSFKNQMTSTKFPERKGLKVFRSEMILILDSTYFKSLTKANGLSPQALVNTSTMMEFYSEIINQSERIANHYDFIFPSPPYCRGC